MSALALLMEMGILTLTDGNGNFNIFSSHGLLPSDLVAQSISKANAHMVHMGLKSSTSHYTLFS